MKGKDTLVHIQHGYDFAGNRTFRYDAIHGAHSELYDYDQVNQIKSLNRGTLNQDRTAVTATNFAEAWNFDKTGNWAQYDKNGTVENRTHNKANEIEGICTHDKNGNMVLMPGLKGKYDAWNRLVEVRDSSDNLLGRYEYNGLNQRIKKTVGATVTKSVFNEKWQELESVTGGSLTSYVWGLRYIDDLVLRQKGDEKLYSLADPNWNVVAVADVSGGVQERMKYDAFGKVSWMDAEFATRNESAFGWNRTFTGQVFDAETELMLYRNRFYSTVLGKFVSRDPIGYLGYDRNLFRYVKNRSCKFTDSSGLKEDPPKDADKEDICAKANSKFYQGQFPGGGFAVCYKGNPLPCTFPSQVQGAGNYAKLLNECDEEHEDQHANDLVCPCGEELEIGNWKSGTNKPHSEVAAHLKSLKCLKKQKEKCKGTPEEVGKCRAFLDILAGIAEVEILSNYEKFRNTIDQFPKYPDGEPDILPIVLTKEDQDILDRIINSITMPK